MTDPGVGLDVAALGEQFAGRGLRCAIVTSARYILDAGRKHQPTLLGPTADDRGQRFAFLRQCVDAAHELDADCVSFWSGTATDAAGRVDGPPRPVVPATRRHDWTR